MFATNRSPVVGRTASPMLIVPTPVKYRLTDSVEVSISATSWSATVYGTTCRQLESAESTMSACGGAGGRFGLVGAGGGGATPAGMTVVRLPDRANAT